MKIVLCTLSLGGGGAERILIGLANYLSSAGHDVTLLAIGKSTPPEGYMIDRSVLVESLDLLSATGRALFDMRNFIGLWKLRRRIVHAKPDVVLSFLTMSNCLAALALQGSGIPLVVSERTDPANTPRDLWTHLRSFLYLRASRIIFQTRCAAEFFSPNFACRAVVLPNPLTRSIPPLADTLPSLRQKNLVAISRLVFDKGIDILIDAFAKVSERLPFWKLLIGGEGSEIESLREQAEYRGIGDRVVFLGWLPDPTQLLCSSAIYILPSRLEGFPNSLCEAMACGCAVIASDCPSGPAEIIEQGISGLLVTPESSADLAAAIEKLATSPQLMDDLASNAINVRKTLAPEIVFRRWEKVLTDAATSTS